MHMFKGHRAVYNGVNCGLLEPVQAIDAQGNDLGTVYILTDWAKKGFQAYKPRPPKAPAAASDYAKRAIANWQEGYKYDKVIPFKDRKP